jgi:hypothetical protein
MERKKRILTEEHKQKTKETMLKRVREGNQKGLFQKGHQVPVQWIKKANEIRIGKHYSPSTEFQKGNQAHLGHFKLKPMEVTV